MIYTWFLVLNFGLKNWNCKFALIQKPILKYIVFNFPDKQTFPKHFLLEVWSFTRRVMSFFFFLRRWSMWLWIIEGIFDQIWGIVARIHKFPFSTDQFLISFAHFEGYFSFVQIKKLFSFWCLLSGNKKIHVSSAKLRLSFHFLIMNFYLVWTF